MQNMDEGVGVFEVFSLEKAVEVIGKEADAIVIADEETDQYKSLKKSGIFASVLEENGSYKELVQKLWFHFNYSQDAITENYHVFIPMLGKFKGKFSKRLRLVDSGSTYTIQMTIYPLENTSYYIFLLDEMGTDDEEEEALTTKKVSTIQNSYLFSMYVDLVKDTTSSISITEISDETVNGEISYSAWRMMIVNMIWPEDQELFLEKTDPEYLKKNFVPGQTSAFDCQMQNLAGEYIWVKLIFSRAETKNDDDFRFVYMVQDIHENTVELMSTLKKYEDLASKDPLTGLFNHGRIETELLNAVDECKKKNEPVTTVIMDLDYFKRVNDEYGHAVGDRTLTHFADVVKEFFKPYDCTVGRWGGEEFVVVGYNIDLDQMKELAEQLRVKIMEEKFNRVGQITCSLGVTAIVSTDSSDQVFERMDKALYKAKEDGRNCVRVV